ncbi:dihydrofolate reductase isoform X2 [Neocloeon triangulifer]|uniref:dihydrofolate reductase isoform X2 n=1 Tax=Neocloeon triangulifer TaxID=2078957 RepID=UPI00286F3EC4|nr:dihydrofolate reductase isoform X2 [Neocloeon triangulifer]
MSAKLELIAAACHNRGIGFKGNLPWRLKSELEFFTRMTTNTKDAGKKNAVIMGRKTWESIPANHKPLQGRLNVVLTRQKDFDLGDKGVVCNSLEEAVSLVTSPPYNDQIERHWVIGGSAIYEAALNSTSCHRVYLTDILADFECDTFFPEMDETKFERVEDPDVPEGIQEEKGICFKYNVFQHK